MIHYEENGDITLSTTKTALGVFYMYLQFTLKPLSTHFACWNDMLKAMSWLKQIEPPRQPTTVPAKRQA